MLRKYFRNPFFEGGVSAEGRVLTAKQADVFHVGFISAVFTKDNPLPKNTPPSKAQKWFDGGYS